MKPVVIILWLIPYIGNCQSWFNTNQHAELMISGVDFNHSGGALKFNHPNGLASDGKNLLLCDRFNNRVLIWHQAPTSWNTVPDLVLGQDNFIQNNPGNGKHQMNWPGNVSVSKSGKLAIADTNNDRLLLWNQFPTSNGTSADISIHLPSISPPGIPLRWGWPWGVWTDGTRLAAVATFGSSLLFWNKFPTQDDQAPDYTIALNTFGTPRNISTDGSSYFFVGDHNAKVTGQPGTFFWNSYPGQSQQNYDFYRDEWIKGTILSSGKMIASGIQSIYTWNTPPTNDRSLPDLIAKPIYYDNGDGVDVVEANGLIYVCNYNGNNVLVYNNPPDASNPDPLFAIGIHDYHLNTLDSIAYMQNPCMSSDGRRLLVTSDFDRRIYVFNQLPTQSGIFPDQVISTQAFDLSPWDHTLFQNKFVAVGKQKLCIWNDSEKIHLKPDWVFDGNIGDAKFTDLHGVALDEQFLYLADVNGKVFIWNGIPANQQINPVLKLDFGSGRLNRLHSDGKYLTVAQTSPPAVFIYKVEELRNGQTNPWKTIGGIGFLNLPSEAIVFNGSLAIANQGFHNVLLWKNIEDAPKASNMIVLGQDSNSPSNIPTIGSNRLFMPGALLYVDGSLWVGEHKFSSRILKFNEQLNTKTQQADIPQLLVYPNPTRNLLHVSWNSAVEDPLFVRMFDLNGRQLNSMQFLFDDFIQLHCEDLANGTYILQSQFKNGKTQRYKIVIQH